MDEKNGESNLKHTTRQFIQRRKKIAVVNIRYEKRGLADFGLIPTVVLLVGTACASLICWAALYGVWVNVLPLKSPTEIDFSNITAPTIGVALLAIALAGVLLILGNKDLGTPRDKYQLIKRRRTIGNIIPIDTPVNYKSVNLAERISRSSAMLGWCLVIAAFSLTLFGFLAPFMGTVTAGQSFFPNTRFGHFAEDVVKWFSFVSLMLGTVCLVLPVTFGPFLIITDVAYVLTHKSKYKNTST